MGNTGGTAEFTKTMNIPIQAGSVTDTTGKIIPTWFRYEDPKDHEIQMIKIENILSSKEINYVGFKMIQFVCAAEITEVRRIFELRYSIGTHKWVFFQMLN